MQEHDSRVGDGGAATLGIVLDFVLLLRVGFDGGKEVVDGFVILGGG